MDKHGIVILEDNHKRADELKTALEESGCFDVIFTTGDGEEGVKVILEKNVEYCISDLILKNLDGLGVLDRLNQGGASTKTVIHSALQSEEVIETCILKGAQFFIAKPCTPQTLVKRIIDLFILDKPEMARTEAKAKFTPSLDEKISKIFISVGIPPHIKGYGYLREGIKLAVKSPDVINNITKKLYPLIGEKYATSPSKVERAIRHAIEVAWSRGRINNINDLFGVQTYLAGEKPTNGEFIALIADKMLLDGA